ncbi:Gfo/Idh/MocA family protein [Clostridium grantii]|uniref:Predicted dehydrogenase n=1 Tax=Clostridium grantii DSM 8605 TaxID=1121316 RepID=A0A1M5XEE5_9CLOT|nr:Gfo/Idh/MocA family oxidoreductase [Clostridium grantii]SHH98200.1 Predicted dehydrogenase [Clostridium grantii DSM 8605]
MKIKWGILAPGGISHSFVKGLKSLEDAEIYAVASRSEERAKEFGEKYDIEKCYGSYEELINDEQVEVIYIATPHNFHKKYSIECLKAGKAVLCEKSVAMNTEELEEILACAKQENVFFMEAMWTRFLPITEKIIEIIKEGTIGDIKMMRTDFSFNAPYKPEQRLFNAKLAGGALLDVGIYPISYSSMFINGDVTNIKSSAYIGETNVDEQDSALLSYENGEMASLTFGLITDGSKDSWIIGTKGKIYIPNFWYAEKAEIYKGNEKIKEINLPHNVNGYEYEAQEVMSCLKDGKIESSKRTWNDTLKVMKIMDSLREEWKLEYPTEAFIK